MASLDDLCAEVVNLTADTGPKQPRFSLRRHATAASGELHKPQFGFMTDRSHRIHTMCFPPGTLIEGVPIEKISRGDEVTCFDHEAGQVVRRRVLGTAHRLASSFVRVITSSGAAITPTVEHPIFTKDGGYVAAEDLVPGDLLCVRETVRAMVRPTQEAEDVLEGVPARSEDEKPGMAQEAVGVDASEKSYAACGDPGEGGNYDARAGASTASPRMGYQDSDQTGEDTGRSDRVCNYRAREDGVPSTRRRERVGVSPVLQTRRGGRAVESVHRGRRPEPSEGGRETPRREEDGVLVWARVESVSRFESGSPGGIPVYNLEVEGAHTYFANGVLVHNCARQSGKTEGDDGILMDAGLFQPNSTNVILGLNGPHLRMNNWDNKWTKMFDRYSGLDKDWNYERMATYYPNGARVIFFGADDSKHLKNILGGTIENGVVIIDEAQSQPGLDELLDNTLPPMMGLHARLILTGVFPEVPAGRFWRESGWREQNGQWVQEQIHGWNRHNWGRLANVHIPDSWALLQRYLKDTGKSINDPDIIRDWMGLPAFDPNATAYRYNAARNGYLAVPPDWLLMAYAAQKDERGRELKYCHPMRPDKDGIMYGMMASTPLLGVKIFALALDPGHASDRASIQGIGFGEGFKGAQHLFDWTTPRKSFVSTGDMYAVLGMVYRAFLRWGMALNPHYDAGSSTNTIDNLQADYGIPIVLAAKKSDMVGQIDRCNDLLTEQKASIMRGSALEQDLTRARRNKQAAERMVWAWDRAHHPDASESWRYATADYFDATIPKEQGPGKPYGYQDAIDKARPSVNYNPGGPDGGESYGGGNIYRPERDRDGGGYGGPWGAG